MAEIRAIDRSAAPASFVLGRKLDGIPFSGYHILIIAVLVLVGSFGRLFAGGFSPFLMEPAPIFFGTIFVVVAIAFIPLVFGRETVGQLETVTEVVPALA